MEGLAKIDLSTMTWREIFDTVEGNLMHMYNMILEKSVECHVEQFEAGEKVYQISHDFNEDTSIIVFIGHNYISAEEYSLEENTLTFASKAQDKVTVQIMQADTLGNLSRGYVEEIKNMFEALSTLNIDTKEIQEENISMRDYLMQVGGEIFASANRSTAAKEYIESVVSGVSVEDGDLAAEIVAARRSKLLLGERLDQMPFKFNNLSELTSSTFLRDGDIALVQDGEFLYLYNIKERYEGGLSYKELVDGKVAVQLFTNYKYHEMIETYKIVGSVKEPVILTDLKYGSYWVSGYIKLHKDDTYIFTEEFLPVTISFSETKVFQTYRIEMGETTYKVEFNKHTNEFKKTMLPSLGDFDISDLGDGTLTGAMRELLAKINALNINKAETSDLSALSSVSPLIVESVEEMRDKSRVYVLKSTGEIYHWVDEVITPSGMLYNANNIIPGVKEILLTEEGVVRLVLE